MVNHHRAHSRWLMAAVVGLSVMAVGYCAPSDFAGTWTLLPNDFDIVFTVSDDTIISNDTINGYYATMPNPSTFRGIIYYTPNRNNPHDIFYLVQTHAGVYYATFAGKKISNDTLQLTQYDVDGAIFELLLVRKNDITLAKSMNTTPKTYTLTSNNGVFLFGGYDKIDLIEIFNQEGSLIDRVKKSYVWDCNNFASKQYIAKVFAKNGVYVVKLINK